MQASKPRPDILDLLRHPFSGWDGNLASSVALSTISGEVMVLVDATEAPDGFEASASEAALTSGDLKSPFSCVEAQVRWASLT